MKKSSKISADWRLAKGCFVRHCRNMSARCLTWRTHTTSSTFSLRQQRRKSLHGPPLLMFPPLPNSTSPSLLPASLPSSLQVAPSSPVLHPNPPPSALLLPRRRGGSTVPPLPLPPRPFTPRPFHSYHSPTLPNPLLSIIPLPPITSHHSISSCLSPLSPSPHMWAWSLFDSPRHRPSLSWCVYIFVPCLPS